MLWCNKCNKGIDSGHKCPRPATQQQHRDQDYLEGYGRGLEDAKAEDTMTLGQLVQESIAFTRGYRDAVSDWRQHGGNMEVPA